MSVRLGLGILVVAGLLTFVAVSDEPFSAFDFDSCEWQKVEIEGTVYSSQDELREDVLDRGGQEAWNEIQENVEDWRVENGELYFKPGECQIEGEG